MYRVQQAVAVAVFLFGSFLAYAGGMSTIEAIETPDSVSQEAWAHVVRLFFLFGGIGAVGASVWLWRDATEELRWLKHLDVRLGEEFPEYLRG